LAIHSGWRSTTSSRGRSPVQPLRSPTPTPETGQQKRLTGSSPNHLSSKRKIQALTRSIQAQSSRSWPPFGDCHALLWRGSLRRSASAFRCRTRLLLSPIEFVSGATTTGLRRFWCRTNRCALQISTSSWWPEPQRCSKQRSSWKMRAWYG
jgi:hypothetical protein